MRTLRDPALPLLEMQEIMGSISGRIPASVEKDIRRQLNNYGSNITSVLCQFPAQQVKIYCILHISGIKIRATLSSLTHYPRSHLAAILGQRSGQKILDVTCYLAKQGMSRSDKFVIK